MALKKWVVGNVEREKAKNMALECDIDPFVALIACGRGISDASELELLLCEEPLLCDPYELADIIKAAEIINNAISENAVISIFGDYDCDGVVATALLYDYLKSRGATVIPYIPDRVEEGYGMNKSAIDTLSKQGVELIITVDNGVSCAQEIEYANSLGIKTVVTDHHIPPEVLPEAQAVVDPHRVDCPSSFKEICGAEVAFKLVCVLDDKEPEQMLPRYADILAVATIGDVMPIINENRSIVKEGIKKIKKNPSAGITAILNMAGLDRNEISADKISFGIVPRINAAGRMGSAQRAFNVLTAPDSFTALKLVGPIDDDNTRRQNIEREIFAEAVEIIEEKGYKYNSVIVVSGKNWHLGVLGIVASRLCERYGKPAIVLSEAQGIAHGSARSYQGFHLYNALHSCSEHLIKYGGHELAAGLSIEEGKIDQFRSAVNEYAQTLEYVPAQLKLDFCINPVGMSVDMAFAIKTLEPFGNGNPSPIFGILGARLDKITALSGGKHLKLLLSKNGGAFQALLFGVTPSQFCFQEGDKLDLAVGLDANFFRDEYNLSVQVKAIRLSGIDQDLYFESKHLYDTFMSQKECNYASVFPKREEVGEIYKYICKGSVLLQRLEYIFNNTIGFAKLQIAVTTLCELGLVTNINGLLTAVSGEKTDLINSPTYKFLCEKVKTL